MIGELGEDGPVGDGGRACHGVNAGVGGGESEEAVSGTGYAVSDDLAVDGDASFETGVDGGHAVGDELLEGVFACGEGFAHGANVAVRSAGGSLFYGVFEYSVSVVGEIEAEDVMACVEERLGRVVLARVVDGVVSGGADVEEEGGIGACLGAVGRDEPAGDLLAAGLDGEFCDVHGGGSSHR